MLDVSKFPRDEHLPVEIPVGDEGVFKKRTHAYIAGYIAKRVIKIMKSCKIS